MRPIRAGAHARGLRAIDLKARLLGINGVYKKARARLMGMAEFDFLSEINQFSPIENKQLTMDGKPTRGRTC
jgi:hypothetical protein